MGQRIEIILFLIWLPQAIFQLLNWVYWWQLKEYRFDRFKLLLKSKSGRKKLDLIFVAIKLLLVLLGYPIIPFLLLDIYYSYKLVKREFYRPKITQRSLFVLLISFLSFPIFVYSRFIAELALIMVPLLAVLVSAIGYYLITKRRMDEARRKIISSGAKVIGVTGSYGKTSTKDFIASILSQKYNTQKTIANQNTPYLMFGHFANVVDNKTQIVVVELGAYKRGEIKRYTDVVRPQIGVITAVEGQHLELFGSVENIEKTKYELIDSLPQGGIAIFNLGNDITSKMYSRTKKFRPDLKVYGYILGEKRSADISARVLSQDDKSILFEAVCKGEKRKFKANLSGKHFVENILPAILIARLNNLTWVQIKRGIETLRNYDRVMVLNEPIKDFLVIDNSKNSPPAGFIAALDYFDGISAKKKVLLTTGIIELGSQSSKIHQELGKRIAESDIDLVYLSTDDFYEDIKKGMGEKSKILQLIDDTKKQKVLDTIPKPGTVVLVEGRFPDHIKNRVLHPK